MTIKNTNNIISILNKNKGNDVSIDKHHKKTMALLKDLLDRKGWNQRKLAKELHKDTTTVNRWAKNSRDIKWDQAEKIAKVIGCHPVEVYMPQKSITLRWYVDAGYEVKKYSEKEQTEIRIPFEYYHPNVKAIQINVPGSHVDGEIYLFDIPQTKKFSSLAIGKYCYCTSSEKYKKKNKAAVNVIGILKSNSDYSLSVIHPLTNQPVNEACKSFQPEDLGIATPVKVKYNPLLISQFVNT